MPFDIQRLPAGLGQLLSTFGGQTPRSMEDQIHGALELIQFYGLQQRQTAFLSQGGVAENTMVPITLSTTNWTVLFAASVNITKTATMTALRGAVLLNRGGPVAVNLASDELGPFGATETGSCAVAWIAPYPILCPPETVVAGIAPIIGTDASATIVTIAEFGLLG